jgi:hypothetical protein
MENLGDGWSDKEYRIYFGDDYLNINDQKNSVPDIASEKRDADLVPVTFEQCMQMKQFFESLGTDTLF